MKLITTILLAVALVSCKAKPFLAGTGQTAIATAQSTFAAAAANVDAAVPHSDATGKELLKVSLTQHSSGQVSLASASKEMQRLQQHDLDATNRLNAERAHWVGYRARVAIWWIVGIAGVSWLGLGIASIFLPVGGIGSAVIRALPFMNPFAWVRDRYVEPGSIIKFKTSKGGKK